MSATSTPFEIPPSSGAVPSSGLGPSKLGWVRAVSGLGVLGLFVGRALGYAPHGILTDNYVRPVEMFGAWLSQTVVVALVATLFVATTQLMKQNTIGIALRIFAAGISGVLLALAIGASAMRLGISLTAIQVIVSTFTAFVCGATVMAMPHARWVGATLVLVGASAFIKHLGWWFGAIGTAQTTPWMINIARQLVTIGWITFALATLLALIWLGTRRGKLASPWTVLSVLNALVATWVSQYAHSHQSGVAAQLIGRTSLGLVEPSATMALVPLAPQVFTAALAFSLAAVATFIQGQLPGIVGGLGLVLLSLAQADVPLCALSLSAGALCLTLAVTEQKAFWHWVSYQTPVKVTP